MKVSPYSAGQPGKRLPLAQERCLNYVQVNKRITVLEAHELLGTTRNLAYRALMALVRSGHLRVHYAGEVAVAEVWVLA